MVAEKQFGELISAMRKAQADVMLFLEEKEQAALSQANGIKTHLEHRSAEMEKSKQELGRIAAINNTVLFLEVQAAGGRGAGVWRWRHPHNSCQGINWQIWQWNCSLIRGGTGSCGDGEKQVLLQQNPGV